LFDCPYISLKTIDAFLATYIDSVIVPGAKQHFLSAACVGLAVNAVKQAVQMNLAPSRQFDWLEFAGCGLVGGVVGLVPDLIEPAVSPNHRGFFHSVGWGTALFYITHGPHSRNWTDGDRTAAQMLCLCYLSHLVADASTPKGINLI
jgi:membrane-bound metal-dependent hydrolase YbcI (DUF457 family)